ncbi:MAG: hypothetical protein JRJ84_23925 [Deltaproteobacteria bacterium]|nr:hypothetical protein [Deltaproteobacteria bacterium]
MLLRVIEHWLQHAPQAEVDGAFRVLPPFEEEDPLRAYQAPYDHNAPPGRVALLLLLGALADNPATARVRRWLAPEESEPPRAEALEAWLRTRPPVPGMEMTLPEALRAPASAEPDSLAAQLRWIAETWGEWMPEALRTEAVRGSDLLAEAHTDRMAGPGPAPVLDFGEPGPGPGRFSEDRDWMPSVVLLAKHTLVWLHQLSETYGEEIRTLDQIPDAELERLAAGGFNALWLIGLWKRSSASREIKRRMGNPEAEASAYALYDYAIAEDLGGDEALADLRERALRHGIRLCADMVPNHVGIDGRWVVAHPEWFLQISHPPYPDYAFHGPDLCADPGVEIRLEDGYWNHSNAAVVFQRVDCATGEVRYLYHGSDGTQMPWNDTAQIDYLRAEAREAVMGTILDVARRFDLIRFDAAMTLAKVHIQRLWHPPPGHGGAIPSRADHALDPDTFEARMPEEFWREVVDRARVEAPNTLMMAEAFWLLEGYFVRELGMHRVYNSAFMNMLRDEDNAGYQETLRNVLAYSPAVLERFVNFVNNPDERTAVDQFGKGDKYFGVCTLLATLPGLPMFGHGQVEGFKERYGMEYRRAYHGEDEDEGFVAWHKQTIFPLLRERDRYSGVRWFTLYEVSGPDGQRIDDVFAYSNRGPDGGRPSLVLYNNAPHPAAGMIRVSAPFNAADADTPELATRTLTEALGLPEDPEVRVAPRELKSGERVPLRVGDLHTEGLTISLGPYECRVLLDWEPSYI